MSTIHAYPARAVNSDNTLLYAPYSNSIDWSNVNDVFMINYKIYHGKNQMDEAIIKIFYKLLGGEHASDIRVIMLGFKPPTFLTKWGQSVPSQQMKIATLRSSHGVQMMASQSCGVPSKIEQTLANTAVNQYQSPWSGKPPSLSSAKRNPTTRPNWSFNNRTIRAFPHANFGSIRHIATVRNSCKRQTVWDTAWAYL